MHVFTNGKLDDMCAQTKKTPFLQNCCGILLQGRGKPRPQMRRVSARVQTGQYSIPQGMLRGPMAILAGGTAAVANVAPSQGDVAARLMGPLSHDRHDDGENPIATGGRPDLTDSQNMVLQHVRLNSHHSGCEARAEGSHESVHLTGLGADGADAGDLSPRIESRGDFDHRNLRGRGPRMARPLEGQGLVEEPARVVRRRGFRGGRGRIPFREAVSLDHGLLVGVAATGVAVMGTAPVENTAAGKASMAAPMEEAAAGKASIAAPVEEAAAGLVIMAGSKDATGSVLPATAPMAAAIMASVALEAAPPVASVGERVGSWTVALSGGVVPVFVHPAMVNTVYQRAGLLTLLVSRGCVEVKL